MLEHPPRTITYLYRNSLQHTARTPTTIYVSMPKFLATHSETLLVLSSILDYPTTELSFVFFPVLVFVFVSTCIFAALFSHFLLHSLTVLLLHFPTLYSIHESCCPTLFSLPPFSLSFLLLPHSSLSPTLFSLPSLFPSFLSLPQTWLLPSEAQ